MIGDLVRFKKRRCQHPHPNNIVAVVLNEWRSPKMRRQKPDMLTVLTSEPATAVLPIDIVEHVTAIVDPDDLP